MSDSPSNDSFTRADIRAIFRHAVRRSEERAKRQDSGESSDDQTMRTFTRDLFTNNDD